MSGPVHALVPAPSRQAQSRQRPPARRPLSERGDASEREADRAADVVARGGSVAGWSFSATPVSAATAAGAVQRQPLDTPLTPAPKDDKDKLAAGASAALDTKAGKALRDKVLSLPVVKPVADAVSSPTAKKVLLGAAAAGVGGLAAAGKELPVQLPAIPLDGIKEGLSAKVVARGPLNAPTTVGLVLTYTEAAPKEKRAPKDTASIAERAADVRAERQRLERQLDPAKAAADRQAEDEIIRLVVQRASFPGVLIPFEPTRPPEAAPVQPGPTSPDQGKQEQEKKPDEGTPVQRERAGGSGEGPTHVDDAAVRPALSGGRALDETTRRFMEARFGVDLAAVRIHDDAGAAASASGLDAAAFTTGTDVVFATGRFDPNTPQGRHLLAHELAHVVQQSRTGEPAPGIAPLRRRGAFETIGIWLGLSEGEWTDKELTDYLALVTSRGKIEGSYDSDNKARAIVARWKAPAHSISLTVDQKVLLVEEMLDGPTLLGDENAIVDLLTESAAADGLAVLGKVPLGRIDADVDNDEPRGRLGGWLERTFQGGRAAVLAGRLELAAGTAPGPTAAPTQAGPAAPTLLAGLSAEERGRIQVLTTDSVTVDRANDMFAAGGGAKVELRAGTTASFDANVAAGARPGLTCVAGYLTGHRVTLPDGSWFALNRAALRGNATVTLQLDAAAARAAADQPGPAGGVAAAAQPPSLYRFTLVTAPARRGVAASAQILVELVGTAPTPAAGPTQGAAPDQLEQRLAAHRITSTLGDPREVAALRAAIAQVPEAHLAEVTGLRITRARRSRAHPEWAGEYQQGTHTITIYDSAFRPSDVRFAGPAGPARPAGSAGRSSDQATQTILHEIGHAVDYAPKRAAAGRFEEARRGLPHRPTPQQTAAVRQAQADYRRTATRSANVPDGFRAAARKDSARAVSSYGDTGWAESYAEAYSLYLASPETLRTLRPNTYEYLDTHLPK